MAKEEFISPERLHQPTVDQRRDVECRHLQHVPKHVEREPLTQHRSGLHRVPLVRRQPVQSCEHQRLHGARQAFRRSVGGVEQQLFQEQRMAGSTCDQRSTRFLPDGRKLGGEGTRRVVVERLEFDAQ